MKTVKIGRLFTGLSFSVIITTLIIFSLFFILWQYYQFSSSINKIKSDMTGNQRNLLKTEVERVVSLIDFNRRNADMRLKNNIRDRINEAYTICSDYYKRNRDIKSAAEIKKDIIQILRPIRFNNGRGYFFITEINGFEHLFADHPEMEGRNLINLQDTNGKFVIREMIAIARQNGEGFIDYTWTKPDTAGNNHIKTAFIKYFKPLEWFIGTGEYISDVENDIQRELLAWIENIRFENGGYVFAGTFEGLSLSGPAKGQNMLNVADANNVKIVQELISLAKKGGGFLEYVMPPLDKKISAPKLSYVTAIKEWQWYIGSGIYIGDISKIISQERSRFIKSILIQVIIMLILITSDFFISITYMKGLGQIINKQFEVFINFFKDSTINSRIIDKNSLMIEEFVTLSDYANNMIRDREKLENELTETEEKFSIIYNHTYQLIGLMDTEGNLIDANWTSLDMIGKNLNDIKGKPFWDLPWWEHSHDQKVKLKKAVKDASLGKFVRFEATHIDKNNEAHIIDFSIKPIINKNGEVTCLIPEGRDITLLKQAQKEVEKGEKITENIINNLPGVFFIYTRDGKLIKWNKNHEKVTGFKKDELYGMKIGTLFHEDYKDLLKEKFEEVFTKGSAEIEAELVIAGKRVPYYFSAIRMQEQDNEFLLGFGIDLSEKVAMDKALKDSELLYRSLFNTANDAIFLMKNDKFEKCNLMSLKMFDCTEEQIIGTSPLDFSPGLQPDGVKSEVKAKKYIKAAYNGIPQFFEWIHRKYDGTMFNVEVNLNRIKMQDETYLLAIVRDITERALAEQKLKDSDARYQFISENIADVIWIYDIKNEKFSYVSPSVFNLRGYTPEEVMNQSMAESLTTESYQRAALSLQKRITERKPGDLSQNIFINYMDQPCKDGSIVSTEVATTLLFDKRGKPSEIIGITRDITERKKTEDALRKERDFSSILIQSSAAFYVAIKSDGRIMMMNDAMLNALGYAADEVANADYILKFVPPDEHEKVKKIFKEFTDENASTVNVNCVLAKDGRKLYVEWHGKPIFKNSKLDYIIGIGIDITERKNAEEELQKSEIKFRTIFESSRDAVGVSKNGIHVLANPAYLRMFGYDSEEELFGHSILELIAPSQMEIIKSNVEKRKKGEPVPTFYESVGKRKDGTEFPMEVHVSTFVLNNEQYSMVVERDITERRRSENAIIQSEVKFRTIFENIQDVYFESSLDGIITEISPSISSFSQYSREELVGRSLYDVYELIEERKALINKLKTDGEVIDYELHLKDKDGKIITSSIKAKLFKGNNGNPLKIVGSIHDITDRKKNEQLMADMVERLKQSFTDLKSKQEELVQSGKLAAIGTLASGIAHEITQPLTGISLGLEKMVIDSINHTMQIETVKEKCSQMLEYVFRIKKTIEHIRVFSRKQETVDLIPMDIHEGIRNALMLVDTQFKNHDIEIKFIPEETMPKIKGNVYKLEQIIINLLSNAKDAVEEKSKMSKEQFVKTIEIKTGLKDHHVFIKIRDNGTGISEEHQKHMFEPFFSTKEAGLGTGLGLSIVFGIIGEMKGNITVESRLNEFTEFTILFPVTEG